MRVLVVEDDDSVADYVATGLREAGHLVDRRGDGREGLIQASSESYDAIVLDRMLPSVDGLKFLQVIRGTGDLTPVLILSSLGDVDERVRGLKAGGDDYLAKPFALSELIARVETIGRRPATSVDETAPLRVGDLEIDLLGRIVSRAGRRIELTPREFRILEYLARNAGRVVTRSMLLEKVWDYNFDPQTNIIDQHVSKLRRKIGDDDGTPLIHTVRGAGYVMRPA